MLRLKERHAHSSAKDACGSQHRLPDEVRFLRNWIGNPLKTGAVAPSGPQLAALMADQLDPDYPGKVVELGPGTGVVTRAILARGIAANRLVSIEYSPDFCVLLRERLPDVTFIQGDAYAMRATLAEHASEPLAGVVSSLPLFTRPPADRLKLLTEALDLLAPGAPFIQFSYALVPPVAEGLGDYTVERSQWIWKNLPPARVWTYRRRA
jgi:phosphatidylethanolamine/phosphatidyl-N-methylethanolamine N-methyltransferase